MIDALLSSLNLIFSGPHFLYLLFGVAFGIVIGVLPALGGIAGFSILIPFIYGMDKISALAKADILSIPYIKGIKIEKPAIPPNAGKTPITIPKATPNKRYRKCGPEKIKFREDNRASIISFFVRRHKNAV